MIQTGGSLQVIANQPSQVSELLTRRDPVSKREEEKEEEASEEHN